MGGRFIEKKKKRKIHRAKKKLTIINPQQGELLESFRSHNDNGNGNVKTSNSHLRVNPN